MLWQRTTSLIKIKCTNSNIRRSKLNNEEEGREVPLSRLLTVSVVVRGPCLLFLPHAFVIPILPAPWTPTHLLHALRFRRFVRCGYLGVRVTRVPIAWKRSWSLARKVILGIRSKMQRGFGGKRHAGKLARFRAIPPVELFPIENSIAFHVDEHIAIYLIIWFPRFYLTVLNNVSRWWI